jgi:hypothetical protein
MALAILNVGDYTLQASILEYIFRLCPKSEKKELRTQSRSEQNPQKRNPPFPFSQERNDVD